MWLTTHATLLTNCVIPAERRCHFIIYISCPLDVAGHCLAVCTTSLDQAVKRWCRGVAAGAHMAGLSAALGRSRGGSRPHEPRGLCKNSTTVPTRIFHEAAMHEVV